MGGEIQKIILVVEDEDSIRKFITTALHGLGHVVLSAASGEMALEVANKQASPIDLLITDLVMPGISGKELAECLCRKRAELKILYLSGYSEYEVMELTRCGNKAGYFMSKPFTISALKNKVAEIFQAG